MREAHRVDVWDQSRRTRLAVGGDENNGGLGVQARQGISVRVLAPARRYQKRLSTGTTFVSSGERTELEWLCRGLKKKFETKVTMVGEDDDLAMEAEEC